MSPSPSPSPTLINVIDVYEAETQQDAYTYYDMLDAITEIGMDILCVDKIAYNIIKWIVSTNHSFPNTRKGWTKLINTQFEQYSPDDKQIQLFTPNANTKHKYWYHTDDTGKTHVLIKSDPERIINWLINKGCLHPCSYSVNMTECIRRDSKS